MRHADGKQRLKRLQGTPPVILIDEYDDPVAQALKNPDDAERVRDALAPVYRQMKDRSGKIRFLMITGGRGLWFHGGQAARAFLRALPEVPLAGTGFPRGTGGVARGRTHGHRGGPSLRHVHLRAEGGQAAEGGDVAGAAQEVRRAVPRRRQARLGGGPFLQRQDAPVQGRRC